MNNAKYNLIENNNSDETILISHRLRGFDHHDATVNGIVNALDNGVKNFEVDTRITKDLKIVINHDPHLKEHFSTNNFISDLTLDELKKIKYKNNSAQSILTLDELFDLIKNHKTKPHLFLDVKEFGLEKIILQKILSYQLDDSITIISWVPEVLKKIFLLNKNIRLCFSHIPIGNKARFFFLKTTLNENNICLKKLLSPLLSRYSEFKNTFHYFNEYNSEVVNDNNFRNFLGKDFSHFVSGFIDGELLNILVTTKGIVCVPYKNIDVNFVREYKSRGVSTSVYSINQEDELIDYRKKIKPDLILTDNHKLIR